MFAGPQNGYNQEIAMDRARNSRNSDKAASHNTAIGGGAKKLLYALKTAQRSGLRSTAKALNSKNTCKACALGMGGQKGGMVNEAGEFPSVCNKSIQAQSTDIQPIIPPEVLGFPMSEFRRLDGYEIEHLGRLGHPLLKRRGSDTFEPLDWPTALDLAADRLTQIPPDRSFFYASGRSSNEAGFVLQLLARAWGTNNINNCSYYCHQATSVGLASTIGTGTATIELDDLAKADTIFVIGANPASNHPRFIHKLAACRQRGGNVIVINPAREAGLVKFALPKSLKSMAKDDIASHYLQPKVGSDIVLLKGLSKAILEQKAEDSTFIEQHCEGFEQFRADIATTTWSEIENHTGLSRTEIRHVADHYSRAENAVFAWGMGITHHLHGCDAVEYIANLALLRGMVGRPGAGLLPLRGHSNVQGIGTVGVKPVLAADVIQRMEEAFGLTLPQGVGYDTLAALQSADDGQIDAAVLLGGNLLTASPDRTWAEAAMTKVGFKVFMTTTLNHGHVFGNDGGESLILPVTARDEEWQPTSQESMFNFVRLSDGGITRIDNVRPEVWILTEIAKRLLPNSPIDFGAFQNHASIRKAIAATVPGLEDLGDLDVARREFHVRGRLLHTPKFKTESGRAHFVTRQTAPAVTQETPSFMLTTVRSEGQFNTIIYERQDSYRGNAGRYCAMMNKDDIAALGKSPNDQVTLVSEHGKLPGMTLKAFDIAQGSIMAYYPETNVLIGRQADPRSHTPAFKSTRVWIE